MSLGETIRTVYLVMSYFGAMGSMVSVDSKYLAREARCRKISWNF